MKRALKILVSAVPIIQVIALMFLCYIEVDNAVLEILSVIFGSSVLTLFVYFYLYFLSRVKFCDVTKFCVIALAVNQLIYYCGAYVKYEVYGNIYTVIFAFTAIMLGLFTDYKKNRE